MVEIRFHRLGGQGAVTLINMLAQAGDLVGRKVQAFPFFGAERRGAPVMCFLRMDDKEIALRSQIYKPDFLVIMSPSLIDAAIEEGTKEGTTVLINMASSSAMLIKTVVPSLVPSSIAASISEGLIITRKSGLYIWLRKAISLSSILKKHITGAPRLSAPKKGKACTFLPTRSPACASMLMRVTAPWPPRLWNLISTIIYLSCSFAFPLTCCYS